MNIDISKQTLLCLGSTMLCVWLSFGCSTSPSDTPSEGQGSVAVVTAALPQDEPLPVPALSAGPNAGSLDGQDERTKSAYFQARIEAERAALQTQRATLRDLQAAQREATGEDAEAIQKSVDLLSGLIQERQARLAGLQRGEILPTRAVIATAP